MPPPQMQPQQMQPVPNRPVKPPRKKGSNKYYYIAIAIVAIIVIVFILYFFVFSGSDTPDALEVENGRILDYQISGGKGYIVMTLEGSHYEMGYAQGQMIGKFIVKGVNEIKSILFETAWVVSKMNSKPFPKESAGSTTGEAYTWTAQRMFVPG